MAQNDVQFTQHQYFSRLTYNPAFAGAMCSPVINGVYRNQWLGLDKAPETGRIEFHAPFANNRSGFGIGLTRDQAGIFRNNYIDLNYAYRIPVGDGRLGLGIKGQFDNGRADWQRTNPADGGDQFLTAGERSQSRFNVGFGLYYDQNNWYLGLSAPQIIKSSFFDQVGISGDEGDFRTYYLMGGLVTDLTNTIKLVPQLLVSYNPSAPIDFDLTANLVFMEKLWLGLNYRLDDSIAAMLSYQLAENFRAGLSYDFTTSSKVRMVSNGTIEFNANYMFKKN